MSEPSWVDNLPPAPQTMSEQEKKEQEERAARALDKILARMPLREIIKAKRDEIEKKGH